MTEARVALNLIAAGISPNEELKVKKDEAHRLSSNIISIRKNDLIASFPSKKPKRG